MPTTVLEEHFRAGLTSDKRSPVNSQRLTRCLNAKPTEFGCVNLETINLIKDDATPYAGDAWPFPQVFRLSEMVMIISKNGLYRWDGVHNTVAGITTYDKELTDTEFLTQPDLATHTAWTNNAGWTFGNGGAIKTPGNSGTLQQLNASMAYTLTAGYLYTVKVTISTVYAEGQIKVCLGDGTYSQLADAEVGTLEFEVVCGDTVTDGVQIYGDANLGCVVTDVTCHNIPKTSLAFLSTEKPFHAVSFRKIWLITNGKHTFFYGPSNGTTGASSGMAWRVFHWTDANDNMKMGCVENFADRMYISGFNASSDLFAGTGDKSWEQLWNTWIQFHQYETTFAGQTIGPNTIFYSKLGGGDYFWPFSVELAMFGLPNAAAFTSGVPFFLDSIRKRDIGFFHAGFDGEVLRILKLGEHLVIYGTNGISIAKPVEGQDGGLSHVIIVKREVGLLDRGAVVNCDKYHMFMDSEGHLWVITPDLQFKHLDYSQWIEDDAKIKTNSATYPPIMLYDSEQGDIYIGNGQRCFVTNEGSQQLCMGETAKIPSGLIQYAGKLYGFYQDLTPTLGSLVRLTTDAIDFKERMLKSIHDIEIGAYDVTNMFVRTLYRTDGFSGWRYSDWILVVDGGFNVQLIEGHSVALEIKYMPGPDARFEYAKINWERRDLRNFRSQQFRMF